MENMIGHLKYLASEIGQRGSCTENERKSAEYIEDIFKKNGIESSVQKFSSPKTFTYRYVFIFLLSTIASLLLVFELKIPSIILGFIAYILFHLEMKTYSFLNSIFQPGRSQNIIGRVKAKGKEIKKIVLVAHYDSSKWGMAFHPALVKGFRTSFKIMSKCISIILILALLTIGLPGNIWGYISIIPSIYLVLTIIIMIHRELFGKYTNGANDNASGVSVVLSLAEDFVKNRYEKTSLWFVLTGCEEVGMIGMIEFLKSYANELKNAYFINLDNLGSRNLKYITAEGMLGLYYSNPELIEIAEGVIKQNQNLSLNPHVYRTLPTDALPLIVRGYKAISIMAFDEKGLLPNWHWKTDIMENVDSNNLVIAYEFVKEMIKKIDGKN